MKKSMLVEVLLGCGFLLIGCSSLGGPQIKPAIPDITLTAGSALTLDLSGHIAYTGDSGSLTWSAANVDVSLLSVEIQGNSLDFMARNTSCETGFVLRLTDQKGASASQNVKVLIERPPAYCTLTTSASPISAGTVAPVTSRLAVGTSVTLTSWANPGWHFVNWSGNVVADINANPTTITVTQDETVVAKFAQDLPPVSCKFHGLCFSPFVLPGQNPDLGSTVSRDQVNGLIDTAAPTVEWIRTYGSGSGNEFAPPQAKLHGLKVAVGAWIGTDEAANQREIAAAVSIANAGNADLLVIGSEVLLRGDQSASQLIAYLNAAKSEVTVPVATADIPVSLLNSPDVIEASDVVLVHIYPMWEGVAIEQAVKSLNLSYEQVKAAAPGKQVIVAETGWLSEGNAIGQAVPSAENAAFYFLNVASWAKARNVDLFYFEAFDEPWKPSKSVSMKSTAAKSLGGHWGIFTSDGVLKPGMQDVFDCQTIPDNWSGPTGICTADSPLLDLTSVPPIGGSDPLHGQVCGANAGTYAIAVYIFVNGWWNKPFYNQELTQINADGSWSCSIVTGGNDSSATRVAAFLVPVGYNPPSLGGEPDIPASIYADATAYVVANR